MNTDASAPGDASAPPAVDVRYAPPGLPAFVALVELHGEQDLDTHQEIERALGPIFGDVLVDLSACPFIDSTVIGVLVARAQVLRREGHRLELIVPPSNRHVAHVVDVVGLRHVLTVHDSLSVVPSQPR